MNILAASFASKFILVALFSASPQASLGEYNSLNECLVASNYVKNIDAKLVCVAKE